MRLSSKLELGRSRLGVVDTGDIQTTLDRTYIRPPPEKGQNGFRSDRP